MALKQLVRNTIIKLPIQYSYKNTQVHSKAIPHVGKTTLNNTYRELNDVHVNPARRTLVILADTVARDALEPALHLEYTCTIQIKHVANLVI